MACFRNIAGLVQDHCNRANTTIKGLTSIFWFPSVYKTYVYNIL